MYSKLYLLILHKKFNHKIYLQSNIAGYNVSLLSMIIRIDYKKYHLSVKKQCFWTTFLDKLSKKDIQYIKLNKDINKNFKENNKKLFDKYYNDQLINKFKHEILIANNNKIYSAFNYPMLYFKIDKEHFFMTETSWPFGNIKKLIDIKELINTLEINKNDISVFHKVEKLIIKKYNDKNFVMAFWRIGDHEVTELLELKEFIKVLTPEEKLNFEKFLKNNLDILSKNEIDISSYLFPEPLLQTIINNNIINEKKSNINLSIFNKEEN